jgi:hypothetical protein
MKKPLSVIGQIALGLALCAIVGVTIYRLISEGDQVRCVAHEFAFGCYSTLWQVLTLGGALVAVVLVACWQHFRDRQ